MLTGPSPPWEKTGQWTENFFNTTPPDYTATTEYGAGCRHDTNKNRILTRAEMFQMKLYRDLKCGQIPVLILSYWSHPLPSLNMDFLD